MWSALDSPWARYQTIGSLDSPHRDIHRSPGPEAIRRSIRYSISGGVGDWGCSVGDVRFGAGAGGGGAGIGAGRRTRGA